MSAQEITLQSVTGVDVQLRIAGAGSRSYAFVIDWHIRLILALAWYLGGTMLYVGSLSFMNAGKSFGASYFWGVVLPGLCLYFLYHPILELAMRGRTPGKRMAGVRIVTRNGDTPGTGAILLRNVFRLIDSMPFAYLIGLLYVIFTKQHVRIGDIAAGTLLILDAPETDGSFAGLASRGGLSPQTADLVHELLERWPALGKSTRESIARNLLASVDSANTAEQLAALDSQELHARLKALLEQPL